MRLANIKRLITCSSEEGFGWVVPYAAGGTVFGDLDTCDSMGEYSQKKECKGNSKAEERAREGCQLSWESGCSLIPQTALEHESHLEIIPP